MGINWGLISNKTSYDFVYFLHECKIKKEEPYKKVVTEAVSKHSGNKKDLISGKTLLISELQQGISERLAKDNIVHKGVFYAPVDRTVSSGLFKVDFKKTKFLTIFDVTGKTILFNERVKTFDDIRLIIRNDKFLFIKLNSPKIKKLST